MGLFSRKKKSILELISFDLRRLDIESFDFIGSEKNISGTEIKKYEKILKKYEFDLFNKLEVIVFPSGEKNFFLKGDLTTIPKIEPVKNLVKKLVKIYGKDFTNSDLLRPEEEKGILYEFFWAGRTWDKVSPVVSIDAIDGEYLSLSILGIN